MGALGRGCGRQEPLPLRAPGRELGNIKRERAQSPGVTRGGHELGGEPTSCAWTPLLPWPGLSPSFLPLPSSARLASLTPTGSQGRSANHSELPVWHHAQLQKVTQKQGEQKGSWGGGGVLLGEAVAGEGQAPGPCRCPGCQERSRGWRCRPGLGSRCPHPCPAGCLSSRSPFPIPSTQG